MGVGLHNLCTEHRNLVPTNWSIDKTSPPPNFSQIQTLQGVSRLFQFMFFFYCWNDLIYFSNSNF